MILGNGTILTGDARLPRTGALAIAGDRVAGGVDVREGGASQVSPERVDLEGRCVAPGFTDAHVHFLDWALSLDRLDLAATHRLADVLAAVRGAGGDGWLVGAGFRDGEWPAGEVPTRQSLDEAAAGRPCALLAHDHHTLWLSTAALEATGLPGAEIVVRDPAGQPTGVFREHAAWELWGRLPQPSEAAVDRALRLGVRAAHREGVTGVHDFQHPNGLAAWQRLAFDRRLDLRVWAALPAERLDEALALELRTGLGDASLRIGPVKAFADGTLGSRTAAMLEPYADGGQGVSLLARDELSNLVARASRGGLDVAVHAIGDAANRLVLDVYEETRELWAPAGRRPRIEHAQLVDPADVPRFAALGVTASVQPSHALTDRPQAEAAWGERAGAAYPYGALRRAGGLLCLGSDAPIEPLRPLDGVRAAAMRDWPPEQALSVADALAGFWEGAARARHAERVLGRLLPGFLADLCVLDRDPLDCPPDELDRIGVVATMVGGRWVHGAPPW